MRRHTALLPLAAVTLAALGCTSRFARPDSAAAPGTAAPTASAAGGPVKSGPPLRVNLANLPVALTDAQAASLKRAWEAASGSPLEIVTSPNAGADVLIVSSAVLADAVAAKQIVALTDSAAEAGDAPEVARRALTWKGTVYALPFTARLRVLAYDPARLRAAGGDERPAPTLEGLRAQWQAAVAAAKGTGANGSAQTPPASSGGTVAGSSLTDDVTLLAAAFGGNLVDEDGVLVIASKPVVQAVEFLKSLRERSLLPDRAGESDTSTTRKPFELVYRDGSAANADDRPVVGLPPALAAYDPATRPFVVSGEVFGVAVSAGAADRALAERFARFLTNPLVAHGLLGEARSLAAPTETAAETSTFARLAAHLTVPSGPLAHARSRAILDRYVRAALDGTLPVGEALAKASAEIEGRPAAPAAPPVSDKTGGAAAPPVREGAPPPAAAPPASSLTP